MMKPWEEEWHAVGGGETTEFRIGHAVYSATREEFVLSNTGPEEARLAAAAPELVRALLALEWSAWSRFAPDVATCPACMGSEPGARAPETLEGHRADCIVDAALRKAGVR
jgi:hypothetical protein